MIYHWFFEGRK